MGIWCINVAQVGGNTSETHFDAIYCMHGFCILYGLKRCVISALTINLSKFAVLKDFGYEFLHRESRCHFDISRCVLLKNMCFVELFCYKMSWSRCCSNF